MTKFGKELMKQYSKLGNDELDVPFKGRNIPTPSGATYVNNENTFPITAMYGMYVFIGIKLNHNLLMN